MTAPLLIQGAVPPSLKAVAYPQRRERTEQGEIRR